MWVDFFYIKDNKKLFSASFSDTALNVLQGRSIEYNPSGHASALKNYKANVLDGLMEKWDSLGQLTDSVIYKDGVVALKNAFSMPANPSLMRLQRIASTIHYSISAMTAPAKRAVKFIFRAIRVSKRFICLMALKKQVIACTPGRNGPLLFPVAAMPLEHT